MDHGADEDRIHDSEPERQAERARKDERRAARRAARAAGRPSVGPGSSTTSAASGFEDDSDEIQEIGSSRAGVNLQGTTSAYFPRKIKASGSPIDLSASPEAPSLRRARSSSAAFRAPARPKSTPTSDKTFVYQRSPVKSPAQLIDDLADDDPIGEGISRASKGKGRASVEPPACPFDDSQLRQLKACVLCREDWSGARKVPKAKWSHMVACKSSMSLPDVISAIHDHLASQRDGPSRSFKRAGSLLKAGAIEFKADVVELSESDDELLAARKPASVVIATPSSSRPVDAPRSFSPFRTPSPSSSARARSGESPSRSPPPKLDLSRFAHESAGSGQSTSGGPCKPSLKIGVVPACPVSTEVLRKLKKCVFCGEDWLLKKSIARKKWEHTFKCSRAQSEPYSVTDVQFAIEQAVLPPPPSLLDEVLPHRKKVKRKGSVVEASVVAAGTDFGREAIMGRVGQVLDEAVDAVNLAADADADDMPPPPFPTTQAFSTSGLGARFGLSRDSRALATDSVGLSPSAAASRAVSSPESTVLAEPSRKRKLGPSTSIENLADPPAELARPPSKLAARLGGGLARGSRGLFDVAHLPSSPEVEAVERPARTPPPPLFQPHRSPSPEWSDDGVLHWEGDFGYVEPEPDDEDDDAVDAAESTTRLTRSKGKGKAAAQDDLEVPDYASWSLKDLKTLVKSYGFKTSAKKVQLVRLLARIWYDLHPDVLPPPNPPSPSKDAERTPRSKSVRKARRKGSDERATSPTRKTPAPVVDPAEWNDLGQQFREMIVRDEDVWLRVLRYEPISFDEFVSMGHQASIKTKGWRNTLKLWLDDQGITFFNEEPTGSRQRYA